MRLKNIPGSREAVGESRFVIQEPAAYRGRFKELFGNENPLWAEIGMGKGKFLLELAQKNPGINFIGIEKYSSVLLRAIQKLEEAPLENLRLIRMDAEEITSVFGEGELEKIFLNFSDPWPKDRHAKRRLTSRQFLMRYDRILDKEGQVEFKTDNRELFAFSLAQLEEAGWQTVLATWDLHADPVLCEGNIMTEYEERFSAAGRPICKYVIRRLSGRM